MIVLDSNQARAVGVHGNSKLTMLRVVAEMTGHRLTLPETVLMECLNTFERSYQVAVDRYVTTLDVSQRGL